MPPPAGSTWIRIKEVTEHVASSPAWVTAARNGSTWFQFCPLHLPPLVSVVSCRITPKFPPKTSRGWGWGWGGGGGGVGTVAGWAQRRREAGINSETMKRGRKASLVPASFKNSINNNSKCNDAQTPGTQVSLEVGACHQRSAGQRREISFASLLGPHSWENKQTKRTAFLYTYK